jgi:hypothetical protein
MTLDQLAIKYGSDKSSQGHNYCPFYEKHLPKNPKRILEIGVKEGRSIAMWSMYFPNAEVHGLDLFVENDIKEVRAELLGTNLSLNNNIVLHQGDQCDWKILEELRKYDFDVIIDDGSHNSRDQLMTFFGLFNGKHYFIEDLHASREPFYSEGLPVEFSASHVLGDMKKFQGHMLSTYPAIFNETYSIHFDQETKIVCVHAQ